MKDQEVDRIHREINKQANSFLIVLSCLATELFDGALWADGNDRVLPNGAVVPADIWNNLSHVERFVMLAKNAGKRRLK